MKFVSKSGRLPAYETAGSAGADLRAYLPDGDVILEPGERKLIPTGLFSQLPAGMEAQIRARSGLSIRHGICLINGVGTVDSDYRGEWNVALVNLGQEPFTISDGDRIAQVVFSRYEQPDFLQTEIIDETERGDGGFGHTGVK
ncbi:MAG: dUTP diphosphatase [Anaerovoracaceae bacterium]